MLGLSLFVRHEEKFWWSVFFDRKLVIGVCLKQRVYLSEMPGTKCLGQIDEELREERRVFYSCFFEREIERVCVREK